MNISELSIIELKALVYDHLGNIERSQQSIQLINQEIQKRPPASPAVETEKSELI